MKVVACLLAVAALLGAGSSLAQSPAEREAAFLGNLRQLNEMLATAPDRVVAEIGDRTVTRADVAEALTHLPPTNGTRSVEQIYREAVQGLLAQKALAIRAREKGIDKEPAVRQRAATGTDVLLANEYLRRAVPKTVTEDMLRDVYKRDIASQPGPEEVRARIIMTYTRSDADFALQRLAAGADFESVASIISKDASAKSGGDLGFVSLGAILPEIGAVVFALAPGQTTSFPVRTAEAWYIVKVEERRRRPPPSFETMRPALLQQLIRGAMPSAVREAMAGLPVRDYGLTGKN